MQIFVVNLVIIVPSPWQWEPRGFSFQTFNRTLTYGPVESKLAWWNLLSHCDKKQVGQEITWARLQAKAAGASMANRLTITFHKSRNLHLFYQLVYTVMCLSMPASQHGASSAAVSMQLHKQGYKPINTYLRRGQSHLRFQISWTLGNHVMLLVTVQSDWTVQEVNKVRSIHGQQQCVSPEFVEKNAIFCESLVVRIRYCMFKYILGLNW